MKTANDTEYAAEISRIAEKMQNIHTNPSGMLVPESRLTCKPFLAQSNRGGIVLAPPLRFLY